MALNNEQKLRHFSAEVMRDAKKISGEIESETKREYQDKLEDGEKNLLSQIYHYIQKEIEKIKKEKGLEISRTDMKSRQEYLQYVDSISSRILEITSVKLKDFMESEKYPDYLFESCKNVIEKAGTDIDILYMPEDKSTVTVKVKKRLDELFENSSKDLSLTVFKQDETIKTGGLRFFVRAKKILINDTFDEKTKRAREYLNSIIGPQLKSVR